MDRKPTISVCIPTYEMHGRGVEMLQRNFESLLSQSFKDFEVVITDDSNDDKIRNFCRDFRGLDIHYTRTALARGMARNTNSSIQQAKGKWIKILYQDDYLANEMVLQSIVDNIGSAAWLITPADNNPNPYWSDVNTLGSPSVLTILNKDPLLLDENLKWTLDLEYYKRLYAKFGPPKIMKNIGICMGVGDWQETNHLSDEIKRKEEHDTSSKA